MQLFEEATKFHLAGNYPEAERIYDMLLTQNHDNPGLLATMGTMYLQSRRYGLAISFLHRAAEKSPQSDIWCNLGIAYKYTGQQEKSRKYLTKAIEHNPSADALANYSALFTNNATPEKAIEFSKKAIKIDPQCGIAHWNMALAMLEASQWETAWDEHEWGFKSKMRIDRKIADAPEWDGTPNKTVVVYGEQGIGDEIMFASMLPDILKTNTVILECHKRLKTLFEQSFPGLICYGTREDKEITWPNDHNIDYRVSIGSLGKFYRRSRSAFPGTPYLLSDTAPKGDKFRVGISWTGGLKAGRIAVRSIPLSWWKSILSNNVEFISLQYTDCADDLAEMENFGYRIKQFDEIKADDFTETAKLVKSCDLVISVCTSVIHLAGALGVPCWVMVPNKPAWRYGVTGGMPWYKSVRLYRQPTGDIGAWMPVLRRVGLDLSELIEGKERKTA